MKDILGDVKEEHYFWLHDGNILKNLYELERSLQLMSQETFSHHVNGPKNDFHNWVRDVHQDVKLAEELLTSTTPEQALEAVRKRLQESSILEKKPSSAQKEKVNKMKSKADKQKSSRSKVKKGLTLQNKNPNRSKLRGIFNLSWSSIYDSMPLRAAGYQTKERNQKHPKNTSRKKAVKKVTAHDAPVIGYSNDSSLFVQTLSNKEPRKLFLLVVGISVLVILLLTVTMGASSLTGAAAAQVENGTKAMSMSSMLVMVVLFFILIKVWREKGNK